VAFRHRDASKTSVITTDFLLGILLGVLANSLYGFLITKTSLATLIFFLAIGIVAVLFLKYEV
jgi:hypothetical protein